MSPLVQLLIEVLVPILFPLVAALAGYLYRRAVQNLPADKRDLVAQVSRSVVTATEQVATSQFNSTAKKQMALEEIEKILAHMGVKASSPLINALVEEAVYSINQSKDAATVVSVPSPMSTVPTESHG